MIRVSLCSILLAAAACSFPELELEGKIGPCAPGWVGETGELCKRIEPADSGSIPLILDGSLDVADASSADITTDTTTADVTEIDANRPDVGGDATGEAAVDAGLPIGCDEGFLLCDDFEGATHPLWTYNSGETTEVSVEFDDTAALSGTGAVRVDVLETVVTQYGPSYGHLFPPIRDTTVYMRAYVYLSAGAFLDLNLFGFSHPTTAGGAVELKVRNNKLGLFIVQGDRYFESSADFPQEEWTCVSMQVDVADAGRVIASAGPATIDVNADTEPAAGLERFYVGPHWARAMQQPATYWLDDVAVDDAPLPCP